MKAYCLGENGNEYDQGLVTFFKQAFEKAGRHRRDRLLPEGQLRLQLLPEQGQGQGCDVIFAPVSIAYSTQIVNQAASLNISLPMLGSDTWDDNMVLQAAQGQGRQGLRFHLLCRRRQPEVRRRHQGYINGNADAKTTNGGDDTVSAVTAMGYDVYYVALEALKAAGSTDPARSWKRCPA